MRTRIGAALVACACVTVLGAGVAEAAPQAVGRPVPDKTLTSLGITETAVTGDGTTVVVGAGRAAGRYGVSATSRSPKGRWGSPVKLRRVPDRKVSDIQVATGKRGLVIAVWLETSYQEEPRLPTRMMTSTRKDNGHWSKARKLKNFGYVDPFDPLFIDLTSNADGDVALVWSGVYGGVATKPADGAWQLAPRLHAGSVAVGPSGTTYLTYTKGAHELLQIAKRPGRKWSEPRQLPSSRVSNLIKSVVDGRGRMTYTDGRRVYRQVKPGGTFARMKFEVKDYFGNVSLLAAGRYTRVTWQIIGYNDRPHELRSREATGARFGKVDHVAMNPADQVYFVEASMNAEGRGAVVASYEAVDPDDPEGFVAKTTAYRFKRAFGAKEELRKPPEGMCGLGSWATVAASQRGGPVVVAWPRTRRDDCSGPVEWNFRVR